MAGDTALLPEAFERIYRYGGWGGLGSGPGSLAANTIEYRAFLARFIEANAVRSVTDLGCGDWQFSHLSEWSGVDYLGVDVVPAIVESNRARFHQANIRFALFSGIEALPGGDLLLAKEVLQHLPNAVVAEYLAAIRRKYRFALLTNAIEPPDQVNREIAAGDFRPLRVQLAPFDAPGAVVFTYYPQSGSHFFKNAVFLMFGDKTS